MSETHVVDWISGHFPDEADRRDYAWERCSLAFACSLDEAMGKAGLSREDVAAKLGIPLATLNRQMRSQYNISLRTIADVYWACDLEVCDPIRACVPFGKVEVCSHCNGSGEECEPCNRRRAERPGRRSRMWGSGEQHNEDTQ